MQKVRSDHALELELAAMSDRHKEVHDAKMLRW